MMTQCPECGSSDIIPDLRVNTDAANPNHKPAYAKLIERPPAGHQTALFIAQEVKSEFHAAMCGSCGYLRLYSKNHAEMWQRTKKVMSVRHDPGAIQARQAHQGRLQRDFIGLL